MQSNTGSRFLRVLFFVALLFSVCLGAQGQSSTPTLQTSEPLWQALLPLTQNLPQNFDLFTTNLTLQVDALTTNNGLLSDSNNSLTLENAALRASLKQSQEAEAISESKSLLLQKALDASTQYTTQAQAEAKALEAENRLLKIGGSILIVGATVFGGYAGGHALHWW